MRLAQPPGKPVERPADFLRPLDLVRLQFRVLGQAGGQVAIPGLGVRHDLFPVALRESAQEVGQGTGGGHIQRVPQAAGHLRHALPQVGDLGRRIGEFPRRRTSGAGQGHRREHVQQTRGLRGLVGHGAHVSVEFRHVTNVHIRNLVAAQNPRRVTGLVGFGDQEDDFVVGVDLNVLLGDRVQLADRLGGQHLRGAELARLAQDGVHDVGHFAFGHLGELVHDDDGLAALTLVGAPQKGALDHLHDEHRDQGGDGGPNLGFVDRDEHHAPAGEEFGQADARAQGRHGQGAAQAPVVGEGLQTAAGGADALLDVGGTLFAHQGGNQFVLTVFPAAGNLVRGPGQDALPEGVFPRREETVQGDQTGLPALHIEKQTDAVAQHLPHPRGLVPGLRLGHADDAHGGGGPHVDAAAQAEGHQGDSRNLRPVQRQVDDVGQFVFGEGVHHVQAQVAVRLDDAGRGAEGVGLGGQVA